MIVVLKPNPNPEQVEGFISWLEGKGISVHKSVGVNETVFGLDINKTGLTPVIEKYLDELIKENGAVRKTLHSVVAN